MRAAIRSPPKTGVMEMNTKRMLLMLAVCMFAATVCHAQDVQIGTWKLNEAKSKIAAGSPKNHTVVYEPAGQMTKVTVDGTNSDGSAAHSEWTGNFDNKDYPVTGDPASDVRSYKRQGARTLLMTMKKDGKVTMTGTVVVSANGKMRTVTTTGTDATGKKFKSIAVYDKQ
jgi:hypothetical protein